MFKRLISSLLSLTMLVIGVHLYDLAYAQFTPSAVEDFAINQLPAPGTMVNLSLAYDPVLIKGLQIHPENPLLFDFIIDAGNISVPPVGKARERVLKTESVKLIKYFLASLTIPENDQWVNLSPYEKNRIVPDELGQTEMGRDMLAEDYILKQLTASLIYPEKKLGQEFWDRVYTKARQMYGTTQVPVNTFNKVWIMADKAKVFVKDNTAFIIAAHLKVMLEEDYLSLTRHNAVCPSFKLNPPFFYKDTHTIGSQIIKEIILPEIEKEVNQGKNFASLRQMFYSMVLATWYKRNLKEALLNQVYANKSKISGVNLADKMVKDKIYRQYLQAYKKGVFNYIKEDISQAGQQPVPRKYFSGGLIGLNKAEVVNRQDPDLAMFTQKDQRNTLYVVNAGMKDDFAMDSEELEHETAIRHAEEFIDYFLKHKKDSEDYSALKEAVNSPSKRRTVILEISNYFMEQWKSRGITDTYSIRDEAIINEGIDWIRGVSVSQYWIKRHLYEEGPKDGDLIVMGGDGSLGVPTRYTFFKMYKKHILYFKHAKIKPSRKPGKILEKMIGDPPPISGDLKKLEDVMRAMQGLIDWKMGKNGEKQKIEALISQGRDPSDYIQNTIKDKLAVVHMGGISLTDSNRPATTIANILNTINILIAMHEKGIKKLIFISSRQVHDIRQGPYAMGKYFEEKIIRKYCLANGMQFGILRPPNVAGSFQLTGSKTVGDRYMRLVPTLISKMREGTTFELPIEGEDTKIGFINYDEFSEAVMRMLAALFNNENDLIIDLVPAESHTLGEVVGLAQEFSKSKGGKKFEVERVQKGILKESISELSPIVAYARLGWQAQSTLMGNIFPKAWHQKTKPKDTKKISSGLDEEIDYMEAVRRAMGDQDLPLNLEDRLECLLGLLAFSAKGAILDRLREDLKSYDPDLQFNFIRRIDKKVMFQKLSEYEISIQDKKGELYDEQRIYIHFIREYWEYLKPNEAMIVHHNSIAPGGIDLNAKNLQIGINQQDKALNMKFDPAMIAEFKKGDFSGISPIIFRIQPLPKNYFAKLLVP